MSETETETIVASEKSLEKNDLKINEDFEENSPIPEVAATVSNKDDPTLPCLTFRFWVLSTLFTALGSAISQFYYFRPNSPTYSVFFVLLISHVAGNWMAKILPTRKFRIWRWEFSLNPGPFNIKEHVCIVVAANSGGVSAYATDIISIQELFYSTRVHFIEGFLLILTTQLLGYGLAGLVRKFLVRPSNMIWPNSLVYATMYNTLHGNTSESTAKFRFFLIAFSIVFVWQFIPQYMFPWLTSMAVLCLISPLSKTMNRLGSAYAGAGILSFSLDWNAIGTFGPLYTPWWAQVNFYFGVILAAWIISPIAYYLNYLDAQKFPFVSTRSMDKDGNRYNQTLILNPVDQTLNVTAYEEYSPIYLPISFAFSYYFSFVSLTATMSHVALFYGKEIWTRYKASRDERNEDIHCKLMRNYPEIPHFWYVVILVPSFIIAIVLGYQGNVNLPWWGTILATGLAAVMVLPIGVIQAISNSQIGLNVITEMVCGYILPGRPIANVYFKTYGYMAMSQCLLLVADLKLGHYMKIPPRTLFITQFYATILGGFVNYWILELIIKEKRDYLDGTTKDPTGQWAGNNSNIFNTASIVWGLIGPGRMFGPDSIYNKLLWGFLVGALLPIPVYLLHRKFPKYRFDLINIPVISMGLTVIPQYYLNFIIMGFLVGFLSQFYAFRFKNAWWKKYNYVLSGALDSSTQILTMVIFFCLNGVVRTSFPEWWGNDADTSGERCFSADPR